jgi:hypothetical protein
MVVSCYREAPLGLPLVKEPWYPLTRRLGGPRAMLESLSMTGIEPQILSRQARSLVTIPTTILFPAVCVLRRKQTTSYYKARLCKEIPRDTRKFSVEYTEVLNADVPIVFQKLFILNRRVSRSAEQQFLALTDIFFSTEYHI